MAGGCQYALSPAIFEFFGMQDDLGNSHRFRPLTYRGYLENRLFVMESSNFCTFILSSFIYPDPSSKFPVYRGTTKQPSKPSHKLGQHRE
jgi:hypothetical protein